MLSSIVDFFKREKIYAYLFLGLSVFYVCSFIMKDKMPEEVKLESPVVDAYKAAEEKLQAKVKDKGSIDAYFEDRPEMLVWVNLFSLIVLGALGGGFIINFLFFFNPVWRARLSATRLPPPADWKISLLFKFFIWFFAGNIVISFVLMLIRNAAGGPQNLYLLVHTTCAEILSLAVIVVLLKRNGSPLSAAGLWIPDGKFFRQVLAGWTGYLAIVPLFAVVILVVILIAKWLNYDPPAHPLVPIFLEEDGKNQYLIYYSLGLAAFFGPVFEEIFFRGFCYPILKQRMGTSLAMVTTAAFFALIHENSFAFWPIFILGLGLNYLYEKRGSLLAPMTMHITHNFVFLSYFFFTKAILSRELGG